MAPRPILLNSCARAATMAEARYRIDAPIAPCRAARVLALDRGAALLAQRAAALGWASARFFTCLGGPGPSGLDDTDMLLQAMDGEPAWLADQLTGADVVVMIATDGTGAATASAIGAACARRSIMTAGLVIGERAGAAPALRALRPYARVLLVSQDGDDIAELLTALRA